MNDVESKELVGTLKDTLKGLTEAERADTAFVTILNHMKSHEDLFCMRREDLIAQPPTVTMTDGMVKSRDELVEYLSSKMPAIKEPNIAFNEFASDTAMASLREQLDRDQKTVQRALGRGDMLLAGYKLSAIKKVLEYIELPQFEEAYNRTASELESTVEASKRAIRGSMASFLDAQRPAESVDDRLDECKTHMAKLIMFEKSGIRCKHLPDTVGVLTTHCVKELSRCQKVLGGQINSVFQQLSGAEAGGAPDSEALQGAASSMDKMLSVTAVFDESFPVESFLCRKVLDAGAEGYSVPHAVADLNMSAQDPSSSIQDTHVRGLTEEMLKDTCAACGLLVVSEDASSVQMVACDPLQEYDVVVCRSPGRPLPTANVE